MPKVVLVTSMWDEAKQDVGERREEELKTTFWKEMLDAGCRTARFENTPGSAWKAIGDVKGPRTYVMIFLSRHSSELPRNLPAFLCALLCMLYKHLGSHMPLVLWVLQGWGKAP